MTGDQVDVHAVTDGKAASTSGVANAEVLVTFAEAAVAGDNAELALARQRVLEEVGPAGLVDAAAVVGNFQRMVRIADSTGISLDGFVDLLTEELRVELGIDGYASSANTPTAGPVMSRLRRAVLPLVGPAVTLMLSLASRRFRAGRSTARKTRNPEPTDGPPLP